MRKMGHVFFFSTVWQEESTALTTIKTADSRCVLETT